MLIYTTDKHIITAVAGTGDNLLPEDIADGYIDYVMCGLYHREDDELVEDDMGQMLSTTNFAELTPDQIAVRLMDYFEVGTDFEILEREL